MHENFFVYHGERMPTLLLPAVLANYANKRANIKVSQTSLFELITYIEKEFPDMYAIICNADRCLNNYICIYVNAQLIHIPTNSDVFFHENDKIEILIAISGG